MSDELLSITESARWLTLHRVPTAPSTVRDWVRAGRVQVVRMESARVTKGRKPGIFIPLATLEHIAACPFCASK